jgi:2,4-didehydro-3-deoxy-L-rhamnonate hydrolase
MRFASVDSALLAVINDTPGSRSGVVIAADAAAAYANWDATVAAASAATAPGSGAAVVAIDDATLSAPSPAPRQVFAIGLNYRAHADETGQAHPDAPNVFTKWVSCLSGPYAPLEIPSDTVDWEAELAIVIGRGGRNISASSAWNHVAGMCVSQDVSERTVQRTAPANQFSCGKSFAGFGPMGPTLVTVDEVRAAGLDPDNLAISCRINDEVVQSSRTGDMIFSVSQVIEYLSRIVELYPGDVIFTGTPSGVGTARTPKRFLQPGEELVTEIEGLGTIRQQCVAAQVRFR